MSFYMNMGTRVLNEGEQAEAYKKRKADEKAAQDQKEEERNSRRYDPNNEYKIGSKSYISDEELLHPTKEIKEKYKKDFYNDMDRNTKAHTIVSKDNKQRYGHHHNAIRFTPNYMQRKDAVNKHIRHHPDAYKECGIFAEAYFIGEE